LSEWLAYQYERKLTIGTKNDKLSFLGVLIVSMCLAASGCRTIGPGTITRDGFDYTAAISESWKKQMLLNLVKIRYADVPVFLEVSSIINQYALETELQGGLAWNAFLPEPSQNVGAQGRYSDRPTITYQPLSGEKFTRSLLTPIRPSSLLALVEAGWPVDRVFRVCVQSINGIDNRANAITIYQEAEPEFYHLISVLARIQQEGAMGTRIEEKDKIAQGTLIFGRDVDEDTEQDMREAKKLLGIDPNGNEFNVVKGALPRSTNEIAILSRSIMEIMRAMAGYIDVPQRDIEDGWVTPPLPTTFENEAGFPPLFRVNSNKQEPKHAYASVKYRDHWFWIDGRDPYSKRVLSFLMILFNLAETSGPSKAPLVTIPTG
jgi:hypothetical protein